MAKRPRMDMVIRRNQLSRDELRYLADVLVRCGYINVIEAIADYAQADMVGASPDYIVMDKRACEDLANTLRSLWSEGVTCAKRL